MRRADESPGRGGKDRSVLFVSTVSSLQGGAERCLLEMAEALSGRGWTVGLAAWREGPLTAAFAKLGGTVSLGRRTEPASPLGGVTRKVPALGPAVDVANFARLWLRPVRSEVAWLETVARRLSATVIHTNCDLSPPAARQASQKTGLPWIAHLRDDWRSWFHPRVRRALGAADALVAPSRFLAGRFGARGLDPVVVADPVSGRELRRPLDEGARQRLRSELSEEEGFLTAVVGRLDEQKGTLRVVEAARRLSGQGSRVRFILAGRGIAPFERRLRAAVEEAGVGGRVRILGYRTDVPRWLPAVDCLLVPSRGEPFGRMIVEGMHAGLPVVAFRDGAAPEILDNDRTGVLVPAGNDAALAAALRGLEGDPTRARQIGRAARDAAARYEPVRVAEHMESLYLRILGE